MPRRSKNSQSSQEELAASSKPLVRLFQYERVSDTKVQSLRTISSGVIGARYQLSTRARTRQMVLQLSTALFGLIEVCAIGERRIKWLKQVPA